MFDWIKKQFTTNNAPDQETKVSKYVEYQLGLMSQNYAGVDVSMATGFRQSDVYTCIRIISEAIGQIPVYVYKENGQKLKKSHRLHKIFCEQPNDYMTRQELMEYLVTVLLIRGQAFLDISKRNNLGQVMELIPLRYYDTVNLNMDTDGIPFAKWVTNDGQSKTSYPPFYNDDLFDVKLQTLDGYSGLSPIRMAAEQIGSGIAAQRHVAKLFENGARLSGVLSTDDVLDDETQQRLAKSWQAAYGGTNNVGKVAVLEHGLKFSTVTMNNDEAQLLELMQFSRAQISSMYKVPLHMLNDTGASTFNNVEQNNLQFLKGALMPIITKLEANFNKLLPPGMSLKFDTTQFARGDIKTQSEVAETLIKNGILSHEESREMFDLMPSDGDTGMFVTQSNNYQWSTWNEAATRRKDEAEALAVAASPPPPPTTSTVQETENDETEN